MRLILLAALLVPSLALAQPSSSSTDPGTMKNDDCARAKRLGKPCVLDLEAIDVEAGVKAPEGSIVSARATIKHSSMIRIRHDFIAEILKSANDVD